MVHSLRLPPEVHGGAKLACFCQIIDAEVTALLLCWCSVVCSGSQLVLSPVWRVVATTGPITTHALHKRSSGKPALVGLMLMVFFLVSGSELFVLARCMHGCVTLKDQQRT